MARPQCAMHCTKAKCLDTYKHIDPNRQVSGVSQKLHIPKIFQELRMNDFAIRHARIWAFYFMFPYELPSV